VEFIVGEQKLHTFKQKDLN